MMTAGFWDLSMIPATGLPATGSVISERADASAPRRCPTPETGKSKFSPSPAFLNKKPGCGDNHNQTGMWYYSGGCLSLSGSGKTQVSEMRRPHSLIP